MTRRGRQDGDGGPTGRGGGGVLLVALLGAFLGATAIMISPITPWTAALVVVGIALILPSAAVLVMRLLRNL